MRKLVLSLLCLFAIDYAYAQKTEALSISKSSLQAAIDQIDLKANKLCQYIANVGSSRSNLTIDEKDDIINRKVPNLFWMYKEAPRYMTTSSGKNGSVFRRRPMWQYFVALKRQSITPFDREVCYELSYDKVYSEENMKNLEGWEKCEDFDNCHVWRQKIRFTQKYYVISYDINDLFEIKSSKRVITTEIDNKYLYVYIIVRKNDEKKIAKLGDVYMVERLNN